MPGDASYGFVSLSLLGKITMKIGEKNTALLQWLEHFWNHENMFETGVVRINEC